MGKMTEHYFNSTVTSAVDGPQLQVTVWPHIPQISLVVVEQKGKRTCTSGGFTVRGKEMHDFVSKLVALCTPKEECALCGEPFDMHRDLIGNAPPHCQDKDSRPGDRFVSSRGHA